MLYSVRHQEKKMGKQPFRVSKLVAEKAPRAATDSSATARVIKNPPLEKVKALKYPYPPSLFAKKA
jgi:hypothetical protein